MSDARMARAIGNMRLADRRRAYVADHPILVSMMVAAVIGSLVSAVDPDVLTGSSIGLALGEISSALPYAWSVFYGAGGLLVLVGFWRLSAEVEAAGLCVYASACGAWAVSIFAARGGPAGVLAGTFFAGLCGGAWCRAWLITTGRSMRWPSRRH